MEAVPMWGPRRSLHAYPVLSLAATRLDTSWNLARWPVELSNGAKLLVARSDGAING